MDAHPPPRDAVGGGTVYDRDPAVAIVFAAADEGRWAIAVCVLERLMGMLLVLLAVQMFSGGVAQFLAGLPAAR